MNIIILGNGPSLKQVINYGFDNFILHCRNKNIQVICMNKILRYFDEQKISNYPDYYVATDALVNIQMYDEILKHVDKFKTAFVSIPHYYHINKNVLKIIKRKDINIQKISFNKSKKTINNQVSKIVSKCQLCEHQNTGFSSLYIASLMKPDNIYIIGMDESYKLSDNEVIQCDESDNSNYFVSSYLKSGEYVSYAPKSRIQHIDKLIQHINCDVYNLSDISNLGGLKMSFDEFLKI